MMNIPRPYELMSATIWVGRRKIAVPSGHGRVLMLSLSKKLLRIAKKAKQEKS